MSVVSLHDAHHTREVWEVWRRKEKPCAWCVVIDKEGKR